MRYFCRSPLLGWDLSTICPMEKERLTKKKLTNNLLEARGSKGRVREGGPAPHPEGSGPVVGRAPSGEGGPAPPPLLLPPDPAVKG